MVISIPNYPEPLNDKESTLLFNFFVKKEEEGKVEFTSLDFIDLFRLLEILDLNISFRDVLASTYEIEGSSLEKGFIFIAWKLKPVSVAAEFSPQFLEKLQEG